MYIRKRTKGMALMLSIFYKIKKVLLAVFLE